MLQRSTILPRLSPTDSVQDAYSKIIFNFIYLKFLILLYSKLDYM